MKGLLLKTIYLLLFLIIFWQIYVHLNLSDNKKQTRSYENLVNYRVYVPATALSSSPAIINSPEYPEIIKNLPQVTNLTLGHVPELQQVWLNVALTADQQLIIIPNIDLEKYSNLYSLYGKDGKIDFNQLTLAQLKQVKFSQDYQWQTLKEFFQHNEHLNLIFWLNLLNAHNLYLQNNLDLGKIAFNTVEQSGIAEQRINFVSPSLIILSHLRNDLIRPTEKKYQLAFLIEAGNQLPVDKPDVNLGYTSFVTVAHKVVIDHSYLIQQGNIINSWYPELILSTRKPTYIYNLNLSTPSQLRQLYLSSKAFGYKGIVTKFRSQDLYFAP
ncbi:hypothetical protein CJP74_04470 [Psittacicella melopsittaci]|uniref:Uncharacterized protein n=1 Tax=Psittacicella melopsittaci TaxID=2028576 RepID=A0A3A1Y8J3_9GAMM|nr:hypothetical protein [Psittacicella melopsittaci]RIY32444.1 hypothetical protein CJP74_04470 [Psittacicella melopsittaci]